MGVLDMNISEIDVLKHACTNFIKINFKKLQNSPRYGKLGNVEYPDEFNTPFDDVFKCPEKCVLFWGFGELPMSYQPGITGLEVIVKISTPSQEWMINRGDGDEIRLKDIFLYINMYKEGKLSINFNWELQTWID